MLILDGEMAVFDQNRISRMHLLMDPPPDAARNPKVIVRGNQIDLRGISEIVPAFGAVPSTSSGIGVF
jgi:hypothetical protein